MKESYKVATDGILDRCTCGARAVRVTIEACAAKMQMKPRYYVRCDDRCGWESDWEDDIHLADIKWNLLQRRINKRKK